MLQLLQKVKAPSYQRSTLPFMGWPLGLHTSIRPTGLKASELVECVNFMVYDQAGVLKTRPAINKYTTTATTGNSAVKEIKKVFIGSTAYELLVDAAYKIYYLDSDPKPVSIGTLEGACEIIPYNGVAVLLDGSFIKYLDGVASIKIAYDDGTGSSGYQFTNLTGDDDTTLALGNGTNTRVATKFTSQAWTAGYTIPPTTYTVTLSAQGTPNASAITARLRLVSDDSVKAAKVLMADASDLATADTETLTFETADITAEMLPGTAYYMSIEHTGGDGANYVKVHCTTVTSGGTAYHYAGAWAADATMTPIAGLRPGMPPKAEFGAVWKSRLFTNDPDNPGWVRFCNLTHLDWSTSNGGGYVAAVDANANSYPVGGISHLFNDLMVYGKQDHPYLSMLQGTTPTDYSLPVLFQKVWTTHKTLINIVSDVWAASYDGIFPLTGVQEYGDVRSAFASESIIDRLQDNWSTTTALAGYWPQESQYWLVMPSYHRILACRTKNPHEEGYAWFEYELYRNDLRRAAYKWTASGSGTAEYYLELAAGGDPSILEPDFLTVSNKKWTAGTVGSLSDHTWDYGDNDSLGYNTVYIRDDSGDPDTTELDIRDVMVPTCLEAIGSNIHIGGSDGFIYYIDSTTIKDQNAHQIRPRFKTAYLNLPFKHINVDHFQFFGSAYAGAGISVSIYTNERYLTPHFTFTHNQPASDALTLGEATMALVDANFLLGQDSGMFPPWRELNFNCRSIQLQVDSVTLAGYPLYIDGLLLRTRYLQI